MRASARGASVALAAVLSGLGCSAAAVDVGVLDEEGGIRDSSAPDTAGGADGETEPRDAESALEAGRPIDSSQPVDSSAPIDAAVARDAGRPDGPSGSGDAGGADAAISAPNAVAVSVNGGPGAANFAYVNGLFTAVTVCVPGSTTACQTIDGVLVDTGSSGLRLLSSELTLALPSETDTAGATIAGCGQFQDGSYAWGPVARADVKMAGERASSVPIQIVADPASAAFPAPPSACSSGGGRALGTPGALGANGILGVGLFEQDCGGPCVTGTAPGVYYRCPASGCQPTRLELTNQVANPASMFAQDNNGLSVSLPAVPPEGSEIAAGTLAFGIGTRTNNALGGATVLAADGNGLITTVFAGRAYSLTVIDSGANAIFFLGTATTGLPACTKYTSFYCPASPTPLSASLRGANGASAAVAFTAANADTMLPVNKYAFSELAGPSAPVNSISWGLPFFFGRTVFIAFDGARDTARQRPILGVLSFVARGD